MCNIDSVMKTHLYGNVIERVLQKYLFLNVGHKIDYSERFSIVL